MTVNYAKIKEAAQNYEKDMTRFLRDIVKYPGESCDEKAHIDRIAEEMKKLEFDKVEIDPMGNVLGYMGTGKTLIGFDATSIPSASAIRATGTSIPMKVLNRTRKSAAAAHRTSSAASYRPFTAPAS